MVQSKENRMNTLGSLLLAEANSRLQKTATFKHKSS